MRYFVLRQDMRNTDIPFPKDFHQKIDVRNTSAEKGGFIAPRTLVAIEPSRHTIFPDVICSPAILVSRDAKDVIHGYDEYLTYKQVIYMDTTNRLMQLYYMPLLDTFDCACKELVFAEKTDLQINIRNEPLRNKSIFQTIVGNRRITLARLDLVESLLMRGFKGFQLTEVIAIESEEDNNG